MIVNVCVTVLVVIVMGYFIGSIPTAYIVTRLKTGKDIRKLGGGNVGGLNTYKEVGKRTAVIVTLIDMCKGAAVAAIRVAGSEPENSFREAQHRLRRHRRRLRFHGAECLEGPSQCGRALRR